MKILLAAFAIAALCGPYAFAEDDAGDPNFHVYINCQKVETNFEIFVDRKFVGSIDSEPGDGESACWGSFEAYVRPGRHTLEVKSAEPISYGRMNLTVRPGGNWILAMKPTPKRGLIKKTVIFQVVSKAPDAE